jgi:hypothetical protein
MYSVLTRLPDNPMPVRAIYMIALFVRPNAQPPIANSPGHGGEITFGANSVWPTVIDVPLTQSLPPPTR